MDAQLAAGFIRHIMAKKFAAQSKKEHGTLYRKLFGQTTAAYMKKRIILSQDHQGISPAIGTFKEDAFVFFWIYLDKPARPTDVILSNAGSAIVAIVTTGAGMAGGAFGTTVTQINQYYGNATGATAGAEFLSTGGNALRGNQVSNFGIAAYQAGDSMVRAAAWAGADGTNNEFSIGLDQALQTGCCAVSGNANKYTIDFRVWGARKDRITTYMTSCENAGGRNSIASRQRLRGLCSEETWVYDSTTQKFELGQ